MNPATPPADYQNATLRCDLVMKGGITSGITYPLAVCEIARTYQVRNVGGTSAARYPVQGTNGSNDSRRDSRRKRRSARAR